MLALAGLFPPTVSLSSGYCTVLSGSEPKWGPLGVFSGTFMEEWRGYSYHISVFLSLSKHGFGQHTDTPALTHTGKTHTGTSLLTQMCESSTFQLPAISSIFSQQTGSHYKRLAVISRTGSSKHCSTRRERGTSYTSPEGICISGTKISLTFE